MSIEVRHGSKPPFEYTPRSSAGSAASASGAAAVIALLLLDAAALGRAPGASEEVFGLAPTYVNVRRCSLPYVPHT